VTSEASTASIDVSPDRAALTATFADLEADLEKAAQSTGTRMVMPLTAGAQHAKIRSAPATALASWPGRAITVLRLTAETGIAAALRHNARRPGRPCKRS
jgi:hypothetical protein